MIEFDDDGYPTDESLDALRRALRFDNTSWREVFYSALQCNHWGEDYYGPRRVDVRGTTTPVFAYHTGGWSGNEDIIYTLRTANHGLCWSALWQRSDSGGHFYFEAIDIPPE